MVCIIGVWCRAARADYALALGMGIAILAGLMCWSDGVRETSGFMKGIGEIVLAIGLFLAAIVLGLGALGRVIYERSNTGHLGNERIMSSPPRHLVVRAWLGIGLFCVVTLGLMVMALTRTL